MQNEARTMQEARAKVEAAGFRFDALRSFVDPDGRGYAFSVECDRRCFNHPMFEVRIRPVSL
jgi:hypothetical protein